MQSLRPPNETVSLIIIGQLKKKANRQIFPIADRIFLQTLSENLRFRLEKAIYNIMSYKKVNWSDFFIYILNIELFFHQVGILHGVKLLPAKTAYKKINIPAERISYKFCMNTQVCGQFSFKSLLCDVSCNFAADYN